MIWVSRTSGIMALLAASIPSTSAAPTSSSIPKTNGTYNLVADYNGAAFFDAFNTFVTNDTVVDPTSGRVNYLSMPDAISQKLVGVIYNASSQSSLSYIGVQDTNVTSNNRNSVRLESKDTFNINTLLVADIRHMPVGCGLWPAFWALGQGDTWPAAGEIDILEAVHEDDFNHVTLHTDPDCAVDSQSTLFRGNLSNTDCNAGNGSDGCSVSTSSRVSLPSSPNNTATLATAGAPFNAQGGAVYAMLWTTTGIAIYIFPHSALPPDLAAGTPNPSTWTAQPLAHFQGTGCAFAQRFHDMQIILNTELCGSWAGTDEVWQSSGCRAQTGVDTCEAFVRDTPGAFAEAYWLLGGVRIYSAGG